MKSIVTCGLFLFALAKMNGQDIWIDYILGKPNIKYFEAKEEVAKDWGINYKAEFAGCVVSDENVKKLEEIATANKKYFAKLEKKFGEDWRKRFDIDVKKKLPFAHDVKHKVWKETVIGRPMQSYLEAKKKVAKDWGINYEPVLLGCAPPKSSGQDRRDKISKENNAYLKAITDHFGEDWRQYFDAEVKKAQNKAKND